MAVEISNHAATRYAERIADQESLADINKYIQLHKEKIDADINTMLEHSQLIYSGKVGPKDKGLVNVYLSGTWVLLIDPAKNKVITLYKVDFRVGEEFNKQFVSLVLEKMAAHKQELEVKKQEVADQRNAYLQIIKDNDLQIAEYRTAIKNLEKINNDYKEIIAAMDVEYGMAELAVRQDVETLMRNY